MLPDHSPEAMRGTTKSLILSLPNFSTIAAMALYQTMLSPVEGQARMMTSLAAASSRKGRPMPPYFGSTDILEAPTCTSFSRLLTIDGGKMTSPSLR